MAMKFEEPLVAASVLPPPASFCIVESNSPRARAPVVMGTGKVTGPFAFPGGGAGAFPHGRLGGCSAIVGDAMVVLAEVMVAEIASGTVIAPVVAAALVVTEGLPELTGIRARN